MSDFDWVGNTEVTDGTLVGRARIAQNNQPAPFNKPVKLCNRDENRTFLYVACSPANDEATVHCGSPNGSVIHVFPAGNPLRPMVNFTINLDDAREIIKEEFWSIQQNDNDNFIVAESSCWCEVKG